MAVLRLLLEGVCPELLKQKDEAESSFIIEKIVGKLLNRTLDLFHFMQKV